MNHPPKRSGKDDSAARNAEVETEDDGEVDASMPSSSQPPPAGTTAAAASTSTVWKKRPAQAMGQLPSLSSSVSAASADDTDNHHIHNVNIRQIVADLTAALTTKQRMAVFQHIRQQVLLSPNNPAHNDHHLLAWFVELGGAALLWSQLGILVVDRPWTTPRSEVHYLLHILHDVLHQASTTLSTTIPRSTILQPADLPDHLHWMEQTAVLYCHKDDRHYHSRNNNSHSLLYYVTAVIHWISACATGQPLQNHCACPFFSQLTTTLAKYGRGKTTAAIWRNLVLSHECRTRCKYDLDMPHILYTLAQQQDSDTNDTLPHVLATAVCLSMDPQVGLAFVLYGDGLYTTFLQSCLTIHNNNAAVVRKRAARLIRLWATQEVSAHLVVQNSALMGVLSGTAIHDPDPAVRREAAEAFGKAAAWIQSPMPQHQAILQALEHLVQCASSSSASPPSATVANAGMVARTLLAQTAIPRNRRIIGANSILVQALISIALDFETASSLARIDACGALHFLAQERSVCRSLLASLNNSGDTTTRFLEALTINLPAVPAAALIIVQLVEAATAAAEEENSMVALTVLTHHEGLLKALIRCAGQPHHPHKDELKAIVVQLVQAL